MSVEELSQWGVLVSDNQRQKLVAEGLDAISVEHFAPLIETTTVVSGRHIRTKRPLLGRYILFAISELWKSIQNMRGVSCVILTADDTPARVPDKSLNDIRSLCVDGVYRPRLTQSQTSKFIYGQRVTPASGPLAFHVGLFDGAASHHREAAMFNIFGREQRLLFAAGDLIAA